MPIYEYVCQKCKHHLEIMQKMSDKPLTRCPQCRGKLEKLFSQTSFQFKGSGWYVSDYTNRGKAETADGTAAKDSTVESKSDSKTESKAEKSVKTAKADSKDKSGSKDGASSGASSDSKSAPK